MCLSVREARRDWLINPLRGLHGSDELLLRRAGVRSVREFLGTDVVLVCALCSWIGKFTPPWPSSWRVYVNGELGIDTLPWGAFPTSLIFSSLTLLRVKLATTDGLISNFSAARLATSIAS